MATKLITVSYGHGTRDGDGKLSASGKLYDYETDKNYRAGDVVVVPVQHYKSGKMYNTLAVVQTTRNIDGEAGQRVKNYLEGNRDKKGRFKSRVQISDVSKRLEVAQQQGLNVSSSHDVTVRTLPGYKNRESNEKWSGSTSRLISREE